MFLPSSETAAGLTLLHQSPLPQIAEGLVDVNMDQAPKLSVGAAPGSAAAAMDTR